jgi:hypothetical protein
LKIDTLKDTKSFKLVSFIPLPIETVLLCSLPCFQYKQYEKIIQSYEEFSIENKNLSLINYNIKTSSFIYSTPRKHTFITKVKFLDQEECFILIKKPTIHPNYGKDIKLSQYKDKIKDKDNNEYFYFVFDFQLLLIKKIDNQNTLVERIDFFDFKGWSTKIFFKKELKKAAKEYNNSYMNHLNELNKNKNIKDIYKFEKQKENLLKDPIGKLIIDLYEKNKCFNNYINNKKKSLYNISCSNDDENDDNNKNVFNLKNIITEDTLFNKKYKDLRKSKDLLSCELCKIAKYNIINVQPCNHQFCNTCLIDLINFGNSCSVCHNSFDSEKYIFDINN